MFWADADNLILQKSAKCTYFSSFWKNIDNFPDTYIFFLICTDSVGKYLPFIPTFDLFSIIGYLQVGMKIKIPIS